MTFEWPYALSLALLAPLLVAFYFLMLRRRRRFAVRYASLLLVREALPKRTRWRRWVPFALLLLSLLSLGVAAARPQAVVMVPTSRTTIILALDVSRSMCSTDVAPNRLAVAQEVARTFVADQPQGTRIGIVAFSGGAQLLVPPTIDRQALIEAIDGLKAGRGTAIGTALLRSVDAIASVNPNVPRIDDLGLASLPALPQGAYEPDIVVLLTDGATTQGVAPLRAAQEAADRHLRVYSVGFGTTTPAPLSCSRAQLGSDAFGGQFGGPGSGRNGADGPPRSILRIDERTLQSIADLTGGTYHRAEDAEQLVGVFRDLPKEFVLQKRHVEISFGFAAAGALLALAAMTLSLAWNRSA